MSFNVVMVGPHDHFFVPVADALEAIGHSFARFKDPADFLQRPEALDNADLLFAVGNLPVSRACLARAPKLRAVISPWTGTEGFDIAAASALGIIVGNGQIPQNIDDMAEATVLMILACLYDLNRSQRNFRDNIFAPAHLTARSLQGKTVGLIGYGGIARGVRRRLSTWGVNFRVYTPRPPADTDVVFVGLAALLAESDIVCVLAPLNPETRNMLDARRLGAMKRGAILINTARGPIIDEDALCALVKDGHILRVGLDVFATEPLPLDSPLRAMPDAVLTPHSVGHTIEQREKLVETAIANVLGVLEGRPPLYIRNPEILETWRARWGSTDV